MAFSDQRVWRGVEVQFLDQLNRRLRFFLWCARLSKGPAPGRQDSGLWPRLLVSALDPPQTQLLLTPGFLLRGLAIFQQDVLSELEKLLRLLGSSSQAGSLWVLDSSDYFQFFQKPKRNKPWPLWKGSQPLNGVRCSVSPKSIQHGPSVPSHLEKTITAAYWASPLPGTG